MTFDGTDIAVWDLKHEIMNIMKLGDGKDFDLALYKDNTDEGKFSDRTSFLAHANTNSLAEYTEDSERIPQSSLVLARRLPAKIPGRGSAHRYVEGKAPIAMRPTTNYAPTKNIGKTIDVNSAQTEEERTAAILRLGEQQWKSNQQEMAGATRVPMTFNKNTSKKANIPEGEPPHGYICYRCGKKGKHFSSSLKDLQPILTSSGHWIQACPTNDDPTFEGRARIKRTTGIPRSMLKVVDQSEIDQLDEEDRQNLMLDADGQNVIVKTDEKEWAKHVEKVNASAAAQEKAGFGDKELASRGLECPIDKRLFVDPMKTPCCGKTYCNECITNALIDSDLVCPGCETEDVIIEDMVSDEEMKDKIKAYEAEKAAEKAKAKSHVSSPKPSTAQADQVDGAAASPTGSKSPASSFGGSTTKSKKRNADDVVDDNLKVEVAPAMKRQKSDGSATTEQVERTASPAVAAATTSITTTNVPAMAQFMPPDMASMMQNMPNMNFPMMPGMPMSMPGAPFMPMPGMMNAGMMQMPNFMPPNFNAMNGMNGMNGASFQNQQPFGMFSQPTFTNPMPIITNNRQQSQAQFSTQYNNNHQQQPNGMNMNGIPSGPRAQTQAQNQTFNKYPPTGPAANKFSNQQRHMGKDEDNAYMRQPVNPHRHQNRQKRVRPSDYREL